MAPDGRPRARFLDSDRLLARIVAQPLARFLQVEAAGGILLLGATAVALVWANSPWQDGYGSLWETSLAVTAGDLVLDEDLRHWVNDGLMALFFFVVGLEIKRELVAGQLASPRDAALPVIAALGGMVVPAAVYLALNRTGDAASGWGIPMATDIAFALGVLALLGDRVPGSLKVLLLGLAIVDDIGAIVVIAAFYTEDLSTGWLALAVAGLAAVVVLRRTRVRFLPVYVGVGAFVWLATFESGIHATIAGVALGLVIPAGPAAERLEDALHPWTSYVVVPVFALANAGIPLSTDAVADAAGSSVTIGVIAGLVLGKVTGVLGAAALAVRLGLARLPPEVGWWHLGGMAALAGIGFTVSIFVTGLAFDDPVLGDQAKLGVLAASGLAAALGAVVLLLRGRATAGGLGSPGRG